MAPDITRLLSEVEDGRAGAMDRLMEAVHEDLERMATGHLARRYGHDLPGVSLEPAALVNESYLKLIKQRNRYDNRGQFFAIATRVMLRVLVDYQRARQAARRGGDRQRVTLSLEPAADETPPSAATGTIEVEALAGALDRLHELDARKADVVRMRVIWGLQMPDIARSLDVSLATVERDWAFAKAWLAREAASS